MNFEFIGYIAAAFGAVSLIPEVLKALRTHHLKDVAWGMLFFLFSSSALWELYGIVRHDIPLMLSSATNLCMEITLVSLKMHYGKRKQPLFGKELSTAQDKE